MLNLKLGDIVEDRVKGELLGTYLVSLIPVDTFITKYACVSLTGKGLANGLFDSLEELSKSTFSTSWEVIGNYETIKGTKSKEFRI